MGIDSLICQDQRESLLSFQQVLDQASASQTLCFSSGGEVAFPITVCGTESGSVSGAQQSRYLTAGYKNAHAAGA